MHLFVEKLSLRSFLSITLFLRERSFHSKSVHLQYIYKDRFIALVQLFFTNLNLGSVKIFDFSFDSLVDENGTNLGRKLTQGFEGLEEIYQLIEKKIDLSNQFKLNNDIIWFKSYLKKKITIMEPFSNTGVNRLINILIMIHAVVFYKKKMTCIEPVFLMLEKKLWLDELCEYGAKNGIEIIENKFNTTDLYNRIKKYIKMNGLVYKLKSFIEISLNPGNRTNISSSIRLNSPLPLLVE